MVLKNKLKRLRNAFYTSFFHVNRKGLKTQFGKNVLLKNCCVRRNGGGAIFCLLKKVQCLLTASFSFSAIITVLSFIKMHD